MTQSQTPVADAIRQRISTRAFLPDPVPQELLRELLHVARHSPSGGNLQPWKVHVVTGAARDKLVAAAKAAIAENPFADESGIAIYPDKLWDPYRSRRFSVGEAMYEKLGIPREDKAARLAHLLRNYEFFGAPAAFFFSLDARFDKGQWAHLGMFMQSLALAAHERGLATCMQEAWAARGKLVREFLDIPDSDAFYCGMAIGFADKSAPVNTLRAARAELDEFVIWRDE